MLSVMIICFLVACQGTVGCIADCLDISLAVDGGCKAINHTKTSILTYSAICLTVPVYL